MRYALIILCTSIPLLAVSLSTRQAYPYDDGDFQVWNTEAEDVTINQDSKITLEEEFHWGDNAREFYYHHYDAGFYCNAQDYLNIGVGYRHVLELKKGKFQQENQPYATATLLWDVSGFKFEDRNRIEYRQFKYRSDSWRYHNKITLKTPWKYTQMEIQPYLSEEVYVSFGDISQFDQNRFSSGLSITLAKRLKAEVYYMLQSSKGSDAWTDTNIFGTKLKFSF